MSFSFSSLAYGQIMQIDVHIVFVRTQNRNGTDIQLVLLRILRKVYPPALLRADRSCSYAYIRCIHRGFSFAPPISLAPQTLEKLVHSRFR